MTAAGDLNGRVLLQAPVETDDGEGGTNASAGDVKAMRFDEAKGIYRSRYWDAQRCDDLPAGVDYAVFDYGVNSGIGRSGRVLRRALALSDDSSMVTDAVIAAAHKADPRTLIVAICDERLSFLQSLKTWAVFGKGWGRRVADVKTAALDMAAANPTPLVPSAKPAGVVAAVLAAVQAMFRRR